MSEVLMVHLRSAPLSLLAGAALVAGSVLAGSPGSASSTPSGEANAPVAARMWLTTPDGASRLAEQAPVQLTRADPGRVDATISVEPGRSFQPMAGFGASLTESAAVVLDRLTPANRDAAMVSLFSPTRGAGLSLLRQPMGASDFVFGSAYTYDDLPPGRTDYGLTRFSMVREQRSVIPLVRRAVQLNPDMFVVATPWSPPAWMKTNGSLVGGELIDDPRIYATYAQYFVKFLRTYRAAGIDVDAVTVQNEPQNRTPSGYPGMFMSAEQQAKFIAVLAPALRRAGLSTQILGYDHNWSMHPDDIARTPAGEVPETEYPSQLLTDPALSADANGAGPMAGIAYHCYFGDPSRMSDLHAAFPDVPIYFTECSASAGATDPPAQIFSDSLRWQSRNLTIGVPRNWSRTVTTWNLALDENRGPHVGGCETCLGVLTVGPGQRVTRNADYYTLGHLSRFVRPGAVRIASTSPGTTGWNGQSMSVAFRNPDGSTVLVLHNENDEARRVAVRVEGWAAAVALPGGSLATLTWPATRRLDDGRTQVDPASVAATAVPRRPVDPCCATDLPANVTDDDATTRWTTGAPQAPGQLLQLDLGRPTRVSGLELDAGASTGDFPRGYRVSTSVDGTAWTTVATGAGSGQVTSVSLPGRSARYVRVSSTAGAGAWWSVAEVRVYTG